MSDRIILDLCGGTGSWSKPYQDAGYDVRLIDPYTVGLWSTPEQVEIGGDVRLVKFPDFDVHGILAAPPCTYFCRMRMVHGRPNDDQFLGGLSVVDACLRLVLLCRPQWWALENPQGYLAAWIGKPSLKFHPYEYGDPWSKMTWLWGDFSIPTKKPVEPTIKNYIKTVPGGNVRSARQRSITPAGFAGAFFEANP